MSDWPDNWPWIELTPMDTSDIKPDGKPSYAEMAEEIERLKAHLRAVLPVCAQAAFTAPEQRAAVAAAEEAVK